MKSNALIALLVRAVAVFSFLSLLAAGAARADTILAGSDLLETDSGATLQELMLPPGFFGPGSDPFVGRVYFRGVPFDCFDPDGPGPAPNSCGLIPTDTVIRRMASAGPIFPATIPIEIVALSLHSVAPLTVTFGGGSTTQLWDLDVRIQVNPLTGAVDPPQPLGSMTIRHESAGGGTFDSLLPVQPLLTFTRVGGPGTIGPMVSPVTLNLQVSGESWSHSANPLLFPGDGQAAIEVPGLTTAFFPGCVCATCPPPRGELAVCYSVDGGAFNPARNGGPCPPPPNPAEGLIVPDPRHVVPNDVYALGTSPGAPPGAPPGGHGYATEGEIFQSAGAPLGAPPNGSNVDRMSAALGVGPAPVGPPFLGPFSPNPGAPAPAPPPPGAPVGTFGLVPNDNVDALSFGRDGGTVLLFSVDPVSIGAAGTSVFFHAVTSPFAAAAALPLPTNPGGGDPGNEAAGDVFKSGLFPAFGSYIPLLLSTGNVTTAAPAGSNALVFDEFLLGLQAPATNGSAIAPPEDDLDALEMSDAGDPIFGVDLIDNATGIGPPDGIPDRFVFFSIDTASPSNILPVEPADLLVTPPGGFVFGVFADRTTMGLLPGDDLDALALSDVATLGVLDPGLDEALFSLSPCSPSVLVGPDGFPGTGDEVSAADVFYTSFTGTHVLYASAAALGLATSDNLDALDILPTYVPPPGGVPPGGGGGGGKKKLSKEDEDRAKHGIRVSQKKRCLHANRGEYQLTIFPFGPFSANLTGLSSGIRTATEFDPATARTTIPTEIVSMDLTGPGPFGPIHVTAGRELGLPPSTGRIEPFSPRSDVPGDSFFDMLLRIETGGMTLHNEQPFRVQTQISSFPPYGHTYHGNQPVLLYDQSGQPVGRLDSASTTSSCSSDADCDDQNPCTDDRCNPITGTCESAPDNTNTCDDGNLCTFGDSCVGGACTCSPAGPCTPAVTNFTNATPVIIADPPAVETTTITVSGVGTYLTDVDLGTFITHTFAADIDMTLKSPAGTIVTLTSDNGGGANNVFNGTIWDDQADPGNQVPFPANTFAASNLVTDTVYTDNVVRTRLVPEEAMGAFIGENPNGVWTLTISDDAGVDTGTLASWSLGVSALATPPVETTNLFPTLDPPLPINNLALTTSTAIVGGVGNNTNRVRLTTNIRHTSSGDLDITLTSPTGKIATITTDNGGTLDNVFNGTLWSDKADPANQVPFPGATFAASNIGTDTVFTNLVTRTPLVIEEALALFNGDDPNGVWTLRVYDDTSNTDTGMLDGWQLEITTASCAGSCLIDCDDHNPCTDDGCDAGSGCFHTNNTAPCNDNDPCTVNDTCGGGVCGGTPRNCNDGNVCTDDTCNPANGQCLHANNTNACDDGNACTVGDTCGVGPGCGPVTENFDGVTAPNLPAGWTQQVIQGNPATDNWKTVTTPVDTPPNAAGTNDAAVITDKVLDTPPILIGSAAAQLTFRNNHNLEFTFDGGVLEIKIGAGAFQDILAAGGSFVTGGYNAPISTAFSSPIAGRMAWSGNSGGYITTVANLPAAANGQMVTLRWRVATDTSVLGVGQFIDTIVLNQNCVAACQPGAPVPPPSEVNDSLRVRKATSSVAVISWTEPSGSYNVYRGSRASLSSWSYNQTCLENSPDANTAFDSGSPPVGTTFFYLVTRETGCGESNPGRDSTGAPEPNPNPCPAAAASYFQDELDAGDNAYDAGCHWRYSNPTCFDNRTFFSGDFCIDGILYEWGNQNCHLPEIDLIPHNCSAECIAANHSGGLCFTVGNACGAGLDSEECRCFDLE